MSKKRHGFKAEVKQLLDLMIHSVYSDRDVFLRELVSNSADALDKVRFLALTEGELIGAASEKPGIRITVEPEAAIIVIEDDGVGMTREEAVKNLGTIAHSGSRAFVEQLSAANADDRPNLIGQFGVGFYSSFMVAREVEVETRSARPGEPGVRWKSKGAGVFTVEECDREHRGTRITLFLKDDAADFAADERISGIIRKHSDFVNWPITVGDKQVNSAKAIWLKATNEVTDEEANSLYKAIAHDWRDPALRVHTKVDTPLQYAAMLFIPEDRPHDLLYPDADRGPRLYARRVMIEEHCRELLPEWLRFVKGVVDSEDISLNMSREMIQKTPVVRKIRKALTKRVLKELSREARRCAATDDVEEGEASRDRYNKIWDAFGICLKEGYYHSKDEWGDLLVSLFRFHTMNSEESELVSLVDYKAAMPEDQDAIYYLTGESRDSALKSPHVEGAKARGWDVLVLTDTVDEWLVGSLDEFDGVPLKSVARGEFDTQDDDEDSGAEKVDIAELAPWMQTVYGDLVKSVRASNRLTSSPCVLVDDEEGASSNMERIMRAANQQMWEVSRHLELNVKHPIVKNLAELHERGRDEEAAPIARLLLDNAFLLEGTVKDAQAIGQRLQAMLQTASSAALSGQESSPSE